MVFSNQDLSASGTPILDRVGFFHFGGNKDNPSHSLKDSLQVKDKEHLRESLIVIPEAFNVRGDYYGTPCCRDASICKQLRDISAELGVCFVAGLIDEQTNRSGAYLIDGGNYQELSQKRGSDISSCYVPAPASSHDNLVPHRGLGIAALVCMDAAQDNNPNKPWRTALLERINLQLADSRVVLCVPSRMTGGLFDPIEIAKKWRKDLNASARERFAVVIASATGSHSLIQIGDSDPVCFKEQRNKVKTTSFQ
ncbi:MAG: hypothetical protein M3Y72_11150 [Acidobacteriota bacterium]|nr:hypothetical protein [Acidobacteriota bacterium]